jgi:two-component system OmpR family sensor kinase
MPDRIWYRSLYWRIAFGFVALLAALLLAQGLLFLWLTDRFVMSPSSRTPQELADHVARDLSVLLTETPSADLESYVRREYGSVYQPFAVLMRDGRRITNRDTALPRGFPGRLDGRPRRSSGPAQRGGIPRGGPGAQIAPIVVDRQQVGVVAVPSRPLPLFFSLSELGPTLIWTGLALLAGGTLLTALLIFRPTHTRLRSLEAAAQALGEGRTDVRAPEAGGDEVAALARAFNRMAGDLDARAAALAASDNARRQLLADVSHELMTPLTAIRGYLETLAMPDVTLDPATRSRYLEIANQETHKLEAIIGDLLDLARLEGGGGTLAPERVPVAELFRRVTDRHGPAIRERELTVDAGVTPPDLEVYGDPQRLEQALQNVAANAVRHTPPRGRIRLEAARVAHPQPGVRIAVRDSGPGIPPEHLPHVFDRFYKADASRTGDASGSGLGLSIVRAIVERHGGSVTAANADGGGTVFEILLPESRDGLDSRD